MMALFAADVLAIALLRLSIEYSRVLTTAPKSALA
jgi:hypothetical protein